jgi:arylsulfatase A-like enzyme
VFSQQARKFLAAEQDRPFMLHLTPRTPHGPATPDRRDAGTFKSVDLPISPALNEPDVSDKPKAIRERDPLEEKELEQLNRFRRLQLDSLLGLDRAILEIVEALRADGRLDRTWIIFTSDNGLALGEHRIGSEKSCPYEECVHVPFVVIPPAGQVVQPVDSRLVANIDLAPTIAQILGVEPPSPLDGRSLLPLFGDQPPAWRDGLLLEMAQGDDDGPSFEAIRSEDWKYVRHASAEEELYDLSTDPYELENLAGVPAHSAEKARLAARLTQLLAEHTRPAAVRPPRATEAQ